MRQSSPGLTGLTWRGINWTGTGIFPPPVTGWHSGKITGMGGKNGAIAKYIMEAIRPRCWVGKAPIPLSVPLDPERIMDAIRTHWSIENNLHWQLDVTFNEDSQRKKRNAARNFSLVSKIALAQLRNNPYKASLKLKRKKAGWDIGFLKELLDAEWTVEEKTKKTFENKEDK